MTVETNGTVAAEDGGIFSKNISRSISNVCGTLKIKRNYSRKEIN